MPCIRMWYELLSYIGERLGLRIINELYIKRASPPLCVCEARVRSTYAWAVQPIKVL
jgi:hypothetical protein